jgi:hypothetical protein
LIKKLRRNISGNGENAVGLYLKLDNAIMLKVSGIVEKMPDNSDFPIKHFISLNTFEELPGSL